MERTPDRVDRHVLVTLVFDQKENLVTLAVDYIYEDVSEKC